MTDGLGGARRVAGGRPRRPAWPGFGGPALWTAIGTYLPGLGLWKAGRRRLGLGILAVWFAALLGLLLVGLLDRSQLLRVAVNPVLLRVLTVILPVIGLIWSGIVVLTHLLLRPAGWDRLRRGLGAGLVGVLCFSVTAPLAVAAVYAWDQANLVGGVFRGSDQIKSQTAPRLDNADPWKNKPRVNILILGGDAGKDRTGVRTDSLMVASIDTRTGATTLIGIPRNTARMPFPADSPLKQYYPNGFYGGDSSDQEYFVNSMWDNLPQQVPADVLGPTDNLSADALKLSVGEATGLPIDYYLLVEISGFKALADALGGITVNINTWVAMGGDTDAGIKPSKWLRPGPNQKLDGTETLWFARGRYGADDFQRMDRQRCTVLAIIEQANPANMLARYEAIAAASKDMVQTDIPQEVLPAIVELSNKVKTAPVRSVTFKHGVDGFYSTNPDFALMRARVDLAIKQSEPAAPSAPAAPGAGQPAPTGAAPSAPTAGQAPAPATPSVRRTLPVGNAPGTPSSTPVASSDDLKSACGYDPVQAEAALANPPF
ncbi:LCP family protein [Enemella evansiae]|uniref:LCP family protein n=1 Tax=Enemella evansiae TaxID=2016499 RepID=UPI00117DC8BB|nr:LCP family protein [Enemella evansiae]